MVRLVSEAYPAAHQQTPHIPVLRAVQVLHLIPVLQAVTAADPGAVMAVEAVSVAEAYPAAVVEEVAADRLTGVFAAVQNHFKTDS